MTISIKVDASEVTDALDSLDSKGSAKALKAAVRKSAVFLKPKVKAEAPKGKTGNLKKRVGYRTKKGRNGDPYSVVRSFAPHHHLVVDGTRDRFTRSGAFRGQMPSNSYISRVADANEDQALRVAEEELARQLDLE